MIILFLCTVFVMLKVLKLKIQAGIVGFESPASGYVEQGINLDSLLIDKPAATFIGLAQGNSMEGDGIFDGDLLIISRSEPIKDNAVVVCAVGGEFVCKRLDMKHRRLLSSSPDYPPYTITDGDDFTIEGTVIRSVRLFKPLDMS